MITKFIIDSKTKPRGRGASRTTGTICTGAFILAHLERDLSVPALARAARMSPRNFARIYVREVGESQARIVEKIRVEAARRLLESSAAPVKVVAARTGFGDDERMRRAFLKNDGVSPLDNRSRFGAA